VAVHGASCVNVILNIQWTSWLVIWSSGQTSVLSCAMGHMVKDLLRR